MFILEAWVSPGPLMNVPQFEARVDYEQLITSTKKQVDDGHSCSSSHQGVCLNQIYILL